jgi:PBSX family phage terminase large subunit
LNLNSRMNLLVGAISSGKTFIGNDLCVKRMGMQPEGNCILIGKTLDTLARNVLDPLRTRYGSEFISNIHGAPKHVDIFGRRCYVVGANDERAYRKIQGISLVYAYCDELTGYPESFVKWLLGRMREKGAKLDATMNPENPRHYIKREFIDNQKLDIAVKHFIIDDNPFLDPLYVEEIKKTYSGVWYKRLILGLWVAAEGAIYDRLDTNTHVVQNLPQMTKYYLGCDYGTSSVTTFWLLGIGEDRKLYFTDFWSWDAVKMQRQLSDPQITEKIDDWLDSLNITPDTIIIPADAQSLAVYMQQYKSKSKRIKKLAWADRSPGSVLTGIHDVNSLINLNILLFHQSILDRGGLDEWQGYVWDSKSTIEDKPLKENDHGPDCGRYVITHTKSIWRTFLNAS